MERTEKGGLVIRARACVNCVCLRTYRKLREAANAVFPGYMIHESAAWSDKMHKWIFCPRRISSEQYDDMKDEKVRSRR